MTQEHLESPEDFVSDEEVELAYDQSVGEGTPNTAPERHVRYDYDETVDPWALDDPWAGDEDEGLWDDESPNPKP
jgi:hypothetical protein